MTKSEFLTALAEKLAEDLPAEAVAQELRYYEGYIDGEIGRGLDEETVTNGLGDPILIARNIAEAPREAVAYRGDAYEEGITESRYQEVRETSDWVKKEVETVYDAGEKNVLEKAAEKAGERAENFSERKKQEDDGTKAQEREARKAFISAVFREADGTLNWRLIGTLAVIALILVLAVVSLVKVVTFLFPVIIVLVIAWVVYAGVISRRKP